jgi:hypothetical protein
MKKKILLLLGMICLGPLVKAQSVYDGCFSGKDEEGTTTTVFFDKLSGYFSTYVESKDKEKLFFASGNFKVKNNKALLTTAPEYDAVKVYGRYNQSLSKDSVSLLIASKKGKEVLVPVSVAVGSGPGKKQLIPVTDGQLEESGGYRINVKAGDSLKVDYSVFDHLVYGFKISDESNYNEFFIDVDDYLSSLMVVEEGVTRAKNDNLVASPMDKKAYAKHPPHVVILHMTGLWLRKGTAPMAAEPVTKAKMTFDGKAYTLLERAALHKAKNRVVPPPVVKKP